MVNDPICLNCGFNFDGKTLIELLDLWKWVELKCPSCQQPQEFRFEMEIKISYRNVNKINKV